MKLFITTIVPIIIVLGIITGSVYLNSKSRFMSPNKQSINLTVSQPLLINDELTLTLVSVSKITPINELEQWRFRLKIRKNSAEKEYSFSYRSITPDQEQTYPIADFDLILVVNKIDVLEQTLTGTIEINPK